MSMYVLVAIIYWLLCIGIEALQHRLEKRFADRFESQKADRQKADRQKVAKKFAGWIIYESISLFVVHFTKKEFGQ